MKQGTRDGKDEATNSQEQPLAAETEELMHKEKAYYLLSSLLVKRDQILSNLGLPSYEVPWLRVPDTAPSNNGHGDAEEKDGVAATRAISDEHQSYHRFRGRRRVPLMT